MCVDVSSDVCSYEMKHLFLLLQISTGWNFVQKKLNSSKYGQELSIVRKDAGGTVHLQLAWLAYSQSGIVTQVSNVYLFVSVLSC